MTDELKCVHCGESQFVAWYSVSESQGLTDLTLQPDGTVTFEYDGCTKQADEAGENEEYWCSNCEYAAPSIEELLGLPATRPSFHAPPKFRHPN